VSPLPPLERLLLVHAAPLEADALADLRPICLGVGKAAAAASLAIELADRRAHEALPAAVLLFGIAGAFPPRHRAGTRLRPGAACLVGAERFGDEGVHTERGFRDVADLALGAAGPFAADEALTGRVARALDLPIVAGVTVSACSGTDAASAAMSQRGSADVETMEGAAVAVVCARFAVPWLELRAISNWTGDRERGEWMLRDAAAVAQGLVRRLLGAASG
jgi:futalosine hydrolase